MKKLWLFKPSEGWHYCGGCIGIVAATWEELQQIWQTYRTTQEPEGCAYCYFDEKVQPYEGRLVQHDDVTKYAVDTWVLTHDFVLADDVPSRVVFNDYNYA